MRLLSFLLVGSILAQPPQAPPAPVWQAGMESDPRYQRQYVFLSPDLSEIILRFEPLPADSVTGPAAGIVVLRAKIKNAIAPAISVQVSAQPAAGGYVYRYTVANRVSARDPIQRWAIVAREGVDRPAIRFGRWRGPSLSFGPPIVRQVLLPGEAPGRFISWYIDAAAGGGPIMPGASESDFIVVSTHKPGFTTAYLKTDPTVEWPRTDLLWSDEVTRQLDPVLRWEWLGHHLLTLGPSFGSAEKPEAIAKHLQLAMEQLILWKSVSRKSAFVLDAQRVVTALIKDGAVKGSMQHPPATDREREIADVLRYSLNVALRLDR